MNYTDYIHYRDNFKLTPFPKRITEHSRIFIKETLGKISVALQTFLNTLSNNNLKVNPKKINHVITGGLSLLAIGISLYWLMLMLQIPSSSVVTMDAKSTVQVSNQNTVSAFALFGEKPLAAQNIFLRGIVITSKSSAGTLDGFTIFEVNGKPTNAIAIGEGLGNGLTLKSIKPESATLIYQGQEMEFILSKDKPTTPATKK